MGEVDTTRDAVSGYAAPGERAGQGNDAQKVLEEEDWIPRRRFAGHGQRPAPSQSEQTVFISCHQFGGPG